MTETAMNDTAAAGGLKSGGTLERVLAAGGFAVTCETSPTATTDLAPLLERVAPLRGVADAVNVTDGATAKAHVSSLVLAGAMMQRGIQPVLQFTVRDRNLIALQGDLLGAGALGIPNILCLTGDDPKKGEEPEATPVFDLDSAGRCTKAALAATGAGERPTRLSSTEAVLTGEVLEKQSIAEAAEAAAGDVEPLEDLHATAHWRRRAAVAMAARALHEIADEAGTR